MPDHPAYHKHTLADRIEIIHTLVDEWSKDWEDDFNRDAKGSMLWTVNAVDLMLIVDELKRLWNKST